MWTCMLHLTCSFFFLNLCDFFFLIYSFVAKTFLCLCPSERASQRLFKSVWSLFAPLSPPLFPVQENKYVSVRVQRVQEQQSKETVYSFAVLRLSPALERKHSASQVLLFCEFLKSNKPRSFQILINYFVSLPTFVPVFSLILVRHHQEAAIVDCEDFLHVTFFYWILLKFEFESVSTDLCD